MEPTKVLPEVQAVVDLQLAASSAPYSVRVRLVRPHDRTGDEAVRDELWD
jgi:hypothetical protein